MPPQRLARSWGRSGMLARRFAWRSTRVTPEAEQKIGIGSSAGVPIRIEIGPRDLAEGTIAFSRRDQMVKEKVSLRPEEAVGRLPQILQEIQDNLFARAKAMRDAHTVRIDSTADFYDFFTPKNKEKPEIHGGFALAHWSGSPEIETRLKEELKVTIRCIPFDPEVRDEQPGQCVISGEPSARRVLFAKSY
jgi:prolyl-tRNA synthetase